MLRGVDGLASVLVKCFLCPLIIVQPCRHFQGEGYNDRLYDVALESP